MTRAVEKAEENFVKHGIDFEDALRISIARQSRERMADATTGKPGCGQLARLAQKRVLRGKAEQRRGRTDFRRLDLDSHRRGRAGVSGEVGFE